MEAATMDFTRIDARSMEKIGRAKVWLAKRFPTEAETVEENLKHFLSMGPTPSDGFKDTLVLHSLARTTFGEYAITEELADKIKTGTLAARLVKAAYMVKYKSQGHSSEMAEQLAEDRKQKVLGSARRANLTIAASLNGG
jgi:hypothetical protein